MHPVFLQGLATEHIEAMTAVAGQGPVGPAGTSRQGRERMQAVPSARYRCGPGTLRAAGR